MKIAEGCFIEHSYLPQRHKDTRVFSFVSESPRLSG